MAKNIGAALVVGVRVEPLGKLHPATAQRARPVFQRSHNSLAQRQRSIRRVAPARHLDMGVDQADRAAMRVILAGFEHFKQDVWPRRILPDHGDVDAALQLRRDRRHRQKPRLVGREDHHAICPGRLLHEHAA